MFYITFNLQQNEGKTFVSWVSHKTTNVPQASIWGLKEADSCFPLRREESFSIYNIYNFSECLCSYLSLSFIDTIRIKGIDKDEGKMNNKALWDCGCKWVETYLQPVLL